MQIRILLPGIIWLGLMVLIIFSPLSEKQILYFECVPSRSFVHLFLYLGLVHTWLGACKKQLKHERLRVNAFRVVFVAALGFSVLTELILFIMHRSLTFSLWHLLFDVIGAGLGILTFRILYRACY